MEGSKAMEASRSPRVCGSSLGWELRGRRVHLWLNAVSLDESAGLVGHDAVILNYEKVIWSMSKERPEP